MVDSTTSPASWWQTLRLVGNGLGADVLQASFELLTPLQQPALADMRVIEDISYGNDPRHRLDLYVPAAGIRDAPVLLFVHGGGFVAGDKRMGAFFANIGAWAVRNGFVAANMTYRLAPQYVWPSAARDIASALGWLRARVADLGGQPENIFLFGHSAGAVHCASYVSSPELYRDASLSGLILASGVYDLRGADVRPMLIPYFGENPAPYADLDFAAAIGRLRLPAAVVVSELEPKFLHAQGLTLAAALLEHDAALPAITRLEAHNHYSGVLAINSIAGRQLESALEAFIRTRPAENLPPVR